MSGWSRLLFVLVVVTIVVATVSAFQSERVPVGRGDACVFNTAETRTTSAGLREPTVLEIADAEVEMRSRLKKQGIELGESAENNFAFAENARSKIARSSQYRVCVPISVLIEHIMMAVALIVFLLVVFIAGRWISIGFKVKG